MTYSLFTDGGARGNPGPAAVGIVLKNNKDEVIYEIAKFVGEKTNNEAEYLGILYGLKAAHGKKVKKLKVFMDSELIVNQINGKYKVKNLRLKKIYEKVIELKDLFESISFTHVKRTKNKRADALVNEALDTNGY